MLKDWVKVSEGEGLPKIKNLMTSSPVIARTSIETPFQSLLACHKPASLFIPGETLPTACPLEIHCSSSFAVYGFSPCSQRD